MSLELLNTSAPAGVRPGAAGFCTVGMTVGLSPALEERLTLLSGYRWLVPPGEKTAAGNPVAFAHWRLMMGERTLSVLSRVGDAGVDYSHRANRLAHHLVLEPAEQVEPGPAWVMMQPGIMRAAWTGEPMVFPEGPDIPKGLSVPRVAEAWAAACGDAGWAGILAETFAGDPHRVAWIIYPPGVSFLPLIDEALSLLPPAQRWHVTFSTYFTDLPAGQSCIWRGCIAGSKAAADALGQIGKALLIDMTRPLAPAPATPYAKAARHGTPVADEIALAEQLALEAARVQEELREPKPADSPLNAGPPEAPAETSERVVGDAEAEALTPSLPDATSIGGQPVGLLEAFQQVARQNPQKPARPPVDRAKFVDLPQSAATSRPRHDPAGRSVPVSFWTIALVWPLLAAGGAIAYFRYIAPVKSFVTPRPPVTEISSGKHESATTLPTTMPATAPAENNDSAPQALHRAIAQKLESAEKDIAERDRTITQLRFVVAEMKDDLIAAKIKAEGANASAEDFEKLKSAYADLQAKLAAAEQNAPSSPGDRAVDLFRDELELWNGNGKNAPDQIQLDSYKPPDGLIVEHTAVQIVLKSAPAAGESGVPTELAVIKLDGPRVVLNWIAPNHGQQLSSAIRAWLRLSRLEILRRGKVIGAVRFLPIRTAEINVDRDAPVAILPDVRWKDAVQHVGLAVPTTMPAGWTAHRKDELTVRIDSAKMPGIGFDVGMFVKGNAVSMQTTFPDACLKLSRTREDQGATVSAKKAVVERDAAAIKALTDASGNIKDPAKQAELDAAKKDYESATAALRDAGGALHATEAAMGELQSLQPFSIDAINRDDGLILCNIRIRRGS